MASLSIPKLAARFASCLFQVFSPRAGARECAAWSLFTLLLGGLSALLLGCDAAPSSSESAVALARARPPQTRARRPGAAVDSLVSAPTPGQDDAVTNAPPADTAAPVHLVVLDKDGTLRLVSIASESPGGDASCVASSETPTAPPATDLVASADGRWVATFAPATDEMAGEVAVFSVEEGGLSKAWACEISTQEGAAVGILTASTPPIVLGLQRSEQTSLLVVDESGSSGRSIGPATSFRVVDGETPRVEGLITENDPPRLDTVVWAEGPGGATTDAAGPDVGALLSGATADALIVNEPDLLLLVARSGPSLGLFDQDGGVEHSPALAELGAPSDRPLVQVAAAEGRVAVLLASGAKGTSATLVVRDADGAYTATPLAGRAGADAPAPHVLVLQSNAAFVVTDVGLEHVPLGPLAGAATGSSVIAPLGVSWAPRAIARVTTAEGL